MSGNHWFVAPLALGQPPIMVNIENEHPKNMNPKN